ncbi:unnamed protein product [Amoebophrya sp. A25]|nr:unnamed protein product [Amoebophrya sp. A25]|eukprot:GSA25T00016238001.1
MTCSVRRVARRGRRRRRSASTRVSDASDEDLPPSTAARGCGGERSDGAWEFKSAATSCDDEEEEEEFDRSHVDGLFSSLLSDKIKCEHLLGSLSRRCASLDSVAWSMWRRPRKRRPPNSLHRSEHLRSQDCPRACTSWSDRNRALWLPAVFLQQVFLFVLFTLHFGPQHPLLQDPASCYFGVSAQLQPRGLLGEYYEMDYNEEDLPCELESLEDAYRGQVPHVQTTETDGLQITDLTPANCKWTMVERTDRYPVVSYPTVAEARLDLGFRKDIRDHQYYINYILYPKQQPPGSPLRDLPGSAANAYLRIGYRLIEVNGDSAEFQLREEILSPKVFMDHDPVFYKFQAFKLEYFCTGVITFQANFFGMLSGDLEIRTQGRYDLRLHSSTAQINLIMGHDHCDGGDDFGYNDAQCGPRSLIQNKRLSDLRVHMSGAIGDECQQIGRPMTLCQDPAYPSNVPAGDICFNTANGCEPFKTYGMRIPDAKCDAARVRATDGATPHPRTIERHRWMRAGRHPLRISIARRFMPFVTSTVSFAFHYKGPDTTAVKRLAGFRMANCTGANGDYYSVKSSLYNFATRDGVWKMDFEDGFWIFKNTYLVDRTKCAVRGKHLAAGENNDDHEMFRYRWSGYSPGAELFDFPWRQDVRSVDGSLLSRDIIIPEGMRFINTPENQHLADPSIPELSVFHDYEWVEVPGNVFLPLHEPKWQADWWGPIEREYLFNFPNYVTTSRAQERRTQTFGQKFFNSKVSVPRVSELTNRRELLDEIGGNPRYELGEENDEDHGNFMSADGTRRRKIRSKHPGSERLIFKGEADMEESVRQKARMFFWFLRGKLGRRQLRKASVVPVKVQSTMSSIGATAEMSPGVLDYENLDLLEESSEKREEKAASQAASQSEVAKAQLRGTAGIGKSQVGKNEDPRRQKNELRDETRSITRELPAQLSEAEFRAFFDGIDVFGIPRMTQREFDVMKAEHQERERQQKEDLAKWNSKMKETAKMAENAVDNERRIAEREEHRLLNMHDPWFKYLESPSLFVKEEAPRSRIMDSSIGEGGTGSVSIDRGLPEVPRPMLPSNVVDVSGEQKPKDRALQNADILAVVVTNAPDWTSNPDETSTTTTSTTTEPPSTSTAPPTSTIPPSERAPAYYGRTFHEVLFFVTPDHPEVILDGKPMVRKSNWPNEFPWSRDFGSDVSDPVPLPHFDYTQPLAARFTGIVNFERPGNYTFRVETDAMFQMIFGGRGLSSEVVLQKLTNEPLQQRLETEKQVYLPGHHYIRIEMLTRNKDKVMFVTYEGPDTEYYEAQAAPNRIVGYARPGIYRGNIFDHEVGITYPIVDGLRSSSVGCRVIASLEGGVQLPRDCSDKCTDVALLNAMSSAMHNNGACDTAETGGYNMFCPEWVYDGGDCDPALESEGTDSPIECLVTPPAGDFKRYGPSQCERTETRGFNYLYDASDNRVIPIPLPEIPNPRETEETFCVSDHDFVLETPTFALSYWPETTSTSTTTYNPFPPAKNPKFTKCCVAQFNNDPVYGTYCMAYGAPIGCYQTMQDLLQRRLQWLRESPEFSEQQLNSYWLEHGDMNVTELVQCKTPKCNVLPPDFTMDMRGERIYKCPWQKNADDIADLYQTQAKEESISCFETRERDTFPPLYCQTREFTSYNYCINDRTREGRRYAHCCVTTYVEADSNNFVCKLTGLPASYPGGCSSYLERIIAPLNTLRAQALQPRVWSSCATAHRCNEPTVFNCPVVYDQNAEAAFKAQLQPRTPPPQAVYGPADFDPFTTVLLIGAILFFVVLPISVHYMRKRYRKTYEPEFVQDLYVEPEFGEDGLASKQVFNRVRPGAAFFQKMWAKYRPPALSEEVEEKIRRREEASTRQKPYATKYSRSLRDKPMPKDGEDPAVDEYTQAILDEIAKKDAEAQEQQRVELEVAERERVAKDPASAFGKKRPVFHETLMEYSQRTGSVPLALQMHQDRVAASTGLHSLQSSDGFHPTGGQSSIENMPGQVVQVETEEGGTVSFPVSYQAAVAPSEVQVDPAIARGEVAEGSVLPEAGVAPERQTSEQLPGGAVPPLRSMPMSPQAQAAAQAAAEDRAMQFDRNRFAQSVPYDGMVHNELERTQWRVRNEEDIKRRGGILTKNEKEAIRDIWNEAHSPKHDRASASRGGIPGLQRTGGLLALADEQQMMTSHDRQLLQLEDSNMSGGNALALTEGTSPGKRFGRQKTGLLDTADESEIRLAESTMRSIAHMGDVVPGTSHIGMAPPVVLPAAVSRARRKKKYTGGQVT